MMFAKNTSFQRHFACFFAKCVHFSAESAAVTGHAVNSNRLIAAMEIRVGWKLLIFFSFVIIKEIGFVLLNSDTGSDSRLVKYYAVVGLFITLIVKLLG